ncbi:MAG: Gfo/Idh/MocA family oxidoreductase [Anaerolineales bacterium]|nr:Gfo/Idh/MocA family oxidoreductase [Anaerolineales bacterium]
MTQPIRLGIVGCGDVMTAYMYSIQQLSARNLVEVSAACDIREERLQYMNNRYGVEYGTTDYHALVQSEDVDLVLVLTSMAEHGPVAMAALEVGKHVLLEKPMAVTLEEAEKLLEVAKQSHGYLLCAPFVHLSPTYQMMWHRIHRGDIGPVKLARSRYGHAGPTWGQWYFRPGGGALFDLSPYNFSSLTGFLGPAKRVMAMTGTAVPERLVDGEVMQVEVEDNTQVLIDFGENVFAVVTSGYTIQQYRSPAIELYGTKGAIQMLGDDWDPDGYELWLNDVGAWLTFKETDPGWLWTDGLRHLVECIQSDIPPVITPEHAFHVLEIMLAAKVSGREACAIPIHSSFPLPQFEDMPELEPAHLIHDRTHKR